jgi:hypothetical protein
VTHPHPAAAQPPYAPPQPPHLRPGAALCAAAELEPEAEQLLAPDMSARDFALALAAAGRVTDALAIVAHAMPRREAVWWAWASARRVLVEPAPAPVRAALDATERWIAQPTDAHRRAAMQAAEAATFGTPAGAAGLAAFFSGGSIAPAGLPDVHPTEFITARAVAGALLMAGLVGDPAEAPARHAAFLQQGLDVMARLNLWPAPGA